MGGTPPNNQPGQENTMTDNATTVIHGTAMLCALAAD